MKLVHRIFACVIPACVVWSLSKIDVLSIFRKRKVLKNLESTWCRIQSAGEKGVGVFAIRDIPAGIDPFAGPKKRKWVQINLRDVAHLGSSVRQLIDDFCIIHENGDVRVYEEGLNGLHIRWFVNHSKDPNLATCDYALSFKTTREIKAGEELFYDYGVCDAKWKVAG